MHLLFAPALLLWIASLAAGALLGWVVCRRRSRLDQAAADSALAELHAQVAERHSTIERLQRESAAALEAVARMEGEATRIPELREEISDLKSQRIDLQERLEAVLTKLAQAGATLESERNQAMQNVALLTGAREEFTRHFEVLANDILEKKSKAFTAENQTSIAHLLDPLKTRLTEFQAKVEEVQKEGIAGRAELKGQLGELKSLNERLSSDATNLVNALKGSSKTQGDWGEFILERILEACGLRKGHEYRVQETFNTTDGRRARPDVTINLRDGRHLVIDAKVSLLDYNDYCNCDDEIKRAASLGRHLASIRGHMKELSGRNYQSLYQLKSLDFVVMFIPIEPAFMLAIAQDEKLWEDAWNKSILVVSPSTLLFVIRTVANLWRQETQARQVQAIVDRGRELYDKFAAFAQDLTKVGAGLDSARDSYDAAIKKLSTGKGNAIRQAEMLKDLGIKPTKLLPPALIESALDESGEPLLLTSVAAEESDYLVEAGDEMGLLSTGMPPLEFPSTKNLPRA